MKKILFLPFLLFFLALTVQVKAENCFYPAEFVPVANVLRLPCVVVQDTCYSAVLEYVPKPGPVFLKIVSVNATDLSPEEIEDQGLLPFYDPDNETLKIPVLLVGQDYFEASLHLYYWGDQLGFYLTYFTSLPFPGSPICLPDSNETPGDGQGEDGGPVEELVFSWQLRDSTDDRPIVCYEYKGSPLLIQTVSTVPPFMAVPGSYMVNDYVPCPRGYFLGCYRYDADGNWYAQYRYDHPLTDYIASIVCPEDQGYHLLIP